VGRRESGIGRKTKRTLILDSEDHLEPCAFYPRSKRDQKQKRGRRKRREYPGLRGPVYSEVIEGRTSC